MGYELHDQSCQDIDECKNSERDVLACNGNKAGLYECPVKDEECPFSPDKTCEALYQKCPPNSRCVNKEGSYECHCDIGYECLNFSKSSRRSLGLGEGGFGPGPGGCQSKCGQIALKVCDSTKCRKRIDCYFYNKNDVACTCKPGYKGTRDARTAR